ncbi:MAG TPA: RsmE family RNA methyltransferase [Candidatus Omnitrophota bacterium]|nr:RsmE family RNA methyltransferase [Candidatus Omnitrophota bacterium]HPS37654.1 RsmE family RNA methyltransferase [Candidatus Omnitrophota bacterium]
MPEKKQNRKLRRFFTAVPLGELGQELWLEPSETQHLRDSIRLKAGDTCLVTDGEGHEATAMIHEFVKDGRVRLEVTHFTGETAVEGTGIFLRVMPVLLRKGKTDLLVEKAQELGVGEFRPLFSDRCEIKIGDEKVGKVTERWCRIAREASKQSGALNIMRIKEPVPLKTAVELIPEGEPLAIFHPGPGALYFSEWISGLRPLKDRMTALNIIIGPEGGFSDDEIAWVRWKRKEKNFWVVGLGEVLLRADTAFVGIVAALRFSGILSPS